jgi:hypothetical protein
MMESDVERFAEINDYFETDIEEDE